MKKLILLTIILWAAFQMEARVMVQFGAGLDLNGKQSFSNAAFSEDSDVETGASLYAEVLSSDQVGLGKLLLGLGLEYQIPRELEDLSLDSHTRKFSYLPVYITGKYVLLPILLSPEIIAQAGYNLPMSNDNYTHSAVNNLEVSGGFYWGLGAGISFKPFVIQAMYKSSKSTYDWEDVDFENLKTTSTNSQISLQLGIRL
ncbi:MAG: hypothetical protein LHW64_02645 [Candidatus Cloacimonetes bacterium]|nr:hypothetical protein [Candidatus Cloacimonadota bacterium]MCB5286688.1 hypothetical protein [Candidatus Cloacimonadota bacterium]MCK9184786.1 hypothetical protein [Candidatus Cloacimonadota bacterium]MDY0229008.1 hypothetical protein [Candidatus Cloacimonadaceae bacterium]